MSVDVETQLRSYAQALDGAAPPITAVEVRGRFAMPDADADLAPWPDDAPLAVASGRLRERMLVVAAVAAAVILGVGVVLLATGGHGREPSTGPASAVSTTEPSAATTSAARAAQAERFVTLLASGNGAALSGYFSPSGQHTESDLARAWAVYERAFGSYVRHGHPTETPCAGLCQNPPSGTAYTLVNMPVVMQRAPVNLQLWYGPAGHVEVAFLIPPDAPATALQGQPLQPSQVAGDPGAVANAVVADLIAGRYSAVTARYDPVAAAGASPTAPQLQQQWQAQLSGLGVLETAGAAVLSGGGSSYLNYSTELSFTRSPNDRAEIHVAVDSDLRIDLVQIIIVPRTAGPGAQTITTP